MLQREGGREGRRGYYEVHLVLPKTMHSYTRFPTVLFAQLQGKCKRVGNHHFYKATITEKLLKLKRGKVALELLDLKDFQRVLVESCIFMQDSLHVGGVGGGVLSAAC